MSVIFRTGRGSYPTWMPPLVRVPFRGLGQDTTGSDIISTGTDIPGSTGLPTGLISPSQPAPPPLSTNLDVYALPGTQPTILSMPVPTIPFSLPTGAPPVPVYNAQAQSAAVSAPVSFASVLPAGLSTWLTSPSMIASIPNWGFWGGAAVIGTVLLGAVRGKGRRRRR